VAGEERNWDGLRGSIHVAADDTHPSSPREARHPGCHGKREHPYLQSARTAMTSILGDRSNSGLSLRKEELTNRSGVGSMTW
jgi:hypothetical protein